MSGIVGGEVSLLQKCEGDYEMSNELEIQQLGKTKIKTKEQLRKWISQRVVCCLADGVARCWSS